MGVQKGRIAMDAGELGWDTVTLEGMKRAACRDMEDRARTEARPPVAGKALVQEVHRLARDIAAR